jgi:hypothetical protein
MPASDDATRKQAPSTLSHSTARTARINVGFLPMPAATHGHWSQTGWRLNSMIPSMTAEALTRTVQNFLSDLLGCLSPEI